MNHNTLQFNNDYLLELRNSLQRLVVDFGLVAFKSGTEVEDMTFEELRFVRNLTRDLLPLYVKIGGPEARNDMRECLSLKVDCIIAPMVESPFALYKFISSLKAVAGDVDFQRIKKGINLESKCAIENLEQIMSSPDAMELDQVTAARSDLSASLHTDVNDPLVATYCHSIVEYANKIQLRSSVGGKIIPETVEQLIKEIPVEMINTRHMVLSVPLIRSNPVECVTQALKFEISLYQALAEHFIDRKPLHEARVKSLEKRLQKTNLLTT